MRPRVSPPAALRHRGRAGGAVWGTSLRRCSGPVSTRGRSRVRCPPAAQVPRAHLPWGAPVLPPGRSPCPRPLVGGSPSPSLSPSALMTSCASSSVGDRGHMLRGATGSAIAVSLCLRAGGGVRMSRGWCVGAFVRCSVWGWWMGVPGGGASQHCEGRLVLVAVPPPAARPLERAARVP